MNAATKIEAVTLARAMADAFGEIESATKSAPGQVGQQKYKYADLTSVIEAIKPALIKHGLHGSNLLRIRASSIYDEAAGVIQRERFAVYRCEDNGKANPNGKFWRVGNVVLTPDELLERAERYRRRAA